MHDDYCAACLMIGQTAADEECLPLILRLEETWLMVEVEAGVAMPAEYRFFNYHSAII